MCDPGPCASVIAAIEPSGGAGTGLPLTGLKVPDWLKKVPSLPSWPTLVQEVNPDSNPPFAMTGMAWTDDVAARPSRTAARVETVTRVDVFIRKGSPSRTHVLSRSAAVWLPLEQIRLLGSGIIPVKLADIHRIPERRLRCRRLQPQFEGTRLSHLGAAEARIPDDPAHSSEVVDLHGGRRYTSCAAIIKVEVILWPSFDGSLSPPPQWRCCKPARSPNRAKSTASGSSPAERPRLESSAPGWHATSRSAVMSPTKILYSSAAPQGKLDRLPGL